MNVDKAIRILREMSYAVRKLEDGRFSIHCESYVDIVTKRELIKRAKWNVQYVRERMHHDLKSNRKSTKVKLKSRDIEEIDLVLPKLRDWI